MNKFLLQTLSLWFITISFITLSKEPLRPITVRCDNFSFSESFDSNSSSNNTLSSNQSGFFTHISHATQSFYDHQSQVYSQQQLESLVYLALLKATLGEVEFAKLVNQYHVNKYGYHTDYLHNILRHYSFEDLEYLIINNHNLTKTQALNTWNWFCDQKYLRKKKKTAGRERIVQEYDQREKTELKRQNDKKVTQHTRQQQEQQKQLLLEQAALEQAMLEQQKQAALEQIALEHVQQHFALRCNTQKDFMKQHLEQCGLDPEQCIYLPQDFELLQDQYQYSTQFCKEMLEHDDSSIWSERLYALQKTQDQNYVQSSQEITLSPQAHGYLLAHDLQPNHYQTCYGTALQQQFHTEICNSFELIAQAQHDFLQPSSFLHAATQCNDAGYWSNQFESMPITMHLIDLGKACYKIGLWSIENGPIYAQAMADGVVESAWDFIHMARHPEELIQNLIKAAWFVCDTMALADQDSIGATLPIAQQQLQERINTINTAASVLYHGAKNSTGPQRVKFTTKFIFDCIFQHKAMQAIGAVAGIVRTQAKIMRTAEYMADVMGHEPAFASASESIAQATEELETTLQKSVSQELAPLGESLEKVGIVATESKIITRSIAEVAADIEKCGVKIQLSNGECVIKIPLSKVELCEEVRVFAQRLIKEANVLINQKLRDQFPSKWIWENGIKQRVTMNIDHILNYEVRFKNNYKTGFLEIELSGGHLAGSTESLAQKGLIEIIDRRSLSTGCLEYDFIDVFTKTKVTKTEFHASWNEQTIIKNSWDLFENPLVPEYPVKGGKIGKFRIIEEQELSIVIKRHEKDINITTSVPYEIAKEII